MNAKQEKKKLTLETWLFKKREVEKVKNDISLFPKTKFNINKLENHLKIIKLY